MSNRTSLAAGIIGIATMLVAVYFALPEPPVDMPSETPEVARKRVRKAFAAPGLHEGAVPPGIRELFARLGEEFRDRKGASAGRFFDVERMLVAIDGDRLLGISDRKGFLDGMKAGMSTNFANLTEVMRWDSTEVRSLKWYAEGSDAAVVTRHVFADGDGDDISVKMRWWVVRRGDRWLVYDYEDMAAGGRVSVLVGTLFRQVFADGFDAARIARISAFVKKFVVARDSILQGDPASGEGFLDSPVPADIPAKIGAIFYLCRGSAKMGLGKHAEAMAAFDACEALDREVVGIHLLRATCHNLLGQHQEAIAAAQKYLDELGPDESAYFQLAAALAAQGRLPEARDAFRKGFDEMPNSPDQIDAFRKTLDAASKKEVGERFARLSKPEKRFERLFDYACENGDDEGAWQFVRAYRELAPKDPQGLLCEGQILLSRDRVDEAGRSFQAALDIASAKPSEPADRLLRHCLNAYGLERGEIAAYEFFAERELRRVFRLLLDLIPLDDFRLADGRDSLPSSDRIERLRARHALRAPGDPWLLFARGEALMNCKDFEAAERVYGEAMSQVKDAGERSRVLLRRVGAMCKMGRGIEAYEKIDRTPNTFDRVAEHLMTEGPADDLTRLIASRWKPGAAEAAFHFWTAQAAWLQKDYSKAATEYNLARELDPDKNGCIDRHRLFRSLLRSKRFAEAHKEIEAEIAENAMSVDVALLFAYEGNTTGLGEQLGRLRRKWPSYDPHSDEDLGPLLRTDPRFRKLLELYPVPKSFEGRQKD